MLGALGYTIRGRDRLTHSLHDRGEIYTLFIPLPMSARCEARLVAGGFL